MYKMFALAMVALFTCATPVFAQDEPVSTEKEDAVAADLDQITSEIEKQAEEARD